MRWVVSLLILIIPVISSIQIPVYEDEEFPEVSNEVPATPRPYTHPGGWATPPPSSGIDLGFTPVQTYLQVRRTSSAQYLPQSDAVKEASSIDEVLSAHRLKEVLRTKKIQEVYSEEGYEDAGYDHGNHEREAEFEEGYDRHKAGKIRDKQRALQHLDDAADSESQIVEKKGSEKKKPKITRKRIETTSMKFAYMNDSEDSESKTKDEKDSKAFDRNKKKQKRAPKKENLTVSPRRKKEFASQKEDFWKFPTGFEYIPGGILNSQTAEKIPKKHEAAISSTSGSHFPQNPSTASVGYINSLTVAHYGNQLAMVRQQPKPIPSYLINLTQSFSSSPTNNDLLYSFEPRRVKSRIKRSLEELERLKGTDAYDKELSSSIDQQEKNILEETFKNLGVVKEALDDSKFKSALPPRPPSLSNVNEKWPLYDSSKYPYFNAQGIDSHSPLRYASHPREFPSKTGQDLEFYKARDAEIDCEPISVSLDNVDKENSTKDLEEQPGSKKRIVRLGDKIQCMKMKYFGEDPLDSPFFKEDDIKKITEDFTTSPSIKNLKYHSTYQYTPNKTMEIFVQEKLNDSNVEGTQERQQIQPLHNQQTLPRVQPFIRNEVDDLRTIPVRETPLEITTPAPIMGMKPPPIRYRPVPYSVIRVPRRFSPPVMTIRHRANCLHPITKMTIHERSDQPVLYHCNDVSLLHTMRDGNPHLKIIPRRISRRSGFIDMSLDESNIVRAGEVFESPDLQIHRRKRATLPSRSLLDKLAIKRPFFRNSRLKNETTTTNSNSSSQSGDIVDKKTTIPLTTIKTTTTTSTTTTTTTPVPATFPTKFQPKPLKRLSGKDFLVRYHKKSQSLNRNEFWKISSTTASPSSARESDEPEKNGHYVTSFSTGSSSSKSRSSKTKRNEPQSLVYLVDETNQGRWLWQ